MHQQGQTILAVLHDNQRVADYFPETLLLEPQRAAGEYDDVLPAFALRGWHDLAHLFQPFIEFGFMRRALVVCLALSLSTTMLGVFLLLRRMSLMGDALSHAILPGVAVGYLLSGMSLLAMTIGGFIAGIAVALVAGWVSRRTPLKRMPALPDFISGRWRWASRWCRCAAPASTCCICCLARFWRWITTRRCLSAASPA
jgi:hypothetical protein